MDATAGRIAKVDEDNHVVYLWLSVIEKADGSAVTDLQGHQIAPDELEVASWDYMRNWRMVGMGHDILDEDGRIIGKTHGSAVSSIVTTREIQKAIGLPDDALPVGWLLGVQVDDSEDWAWVKEQAASADGLMGSLGGIGILEPVE